MQEGGVPASLVLSASFTTRCTPSNRDFIDAALCTVQRTLAAVPYPLQIYTNPCAGPSQFSACRQQSQAPFPSWSEACGTAPSQEGSRGKCQSPHLAALASSLGLEAGGLLVLPQATYGHELASFPHPPSRAEPTERLKVWEVSGQNCLHPKSTWPEARARSWAGAPTPPAGGNPSLDSQPVCPQPQCPLPSSPALQQEARGF